MRPTTALRALPCFLPRALALGCAALLGACSTTSPTAPAAPTPPVSAAQVGEYRAGSGILKGYLAAGEMPDSLALVAAPPAAGSAAQAADEAATRQLTALAAGPRGALARKDANLHFPAAASVYACALGVQVSEADTPNLNMLLRRTLTDAGLATYKAKNHYQRTRPFVALKLPSCTPDEEAKLAKDGSYPSGHSSLGWAWALVLTEAAPDRTDALLQRGRAFAQSRAVCGVHWQSDIQAGMLVGAGTVARLHANETFRAQLNAARAEITAARQAGKVPSAGDCAAEAEALAISSRIAP